MSPTCLTLRRATLPVGQALLYRAALARPGGPLRDGWPRRRLRPPRLARVTRGRLATAGARHLRRALPASLRLCAAPSMSTVWGGRPRPLRSQNVCARQAISIVLISESTPFKLARLSSTRYTQHTTKHTTLLRYLADALFDLSRCIAVVRHGPSPLCCYGASLLALFLLVEVLIALL